MPFEDRRSIERLAELSMTPIKLEVTVVNDQLVQLDSKKGMYPVGDIIVYRDGIEIIESRGEIVTGQIYIKPLNAIVSYKG
jgi:hypothetical protein